MSLLVPGLHKQRAVCPHLNSAPWPEVCETAPAPGRLALGEGLCPALESVIGALALGMPALALPTRDLRTDHCQCWSNEGDRAPRLAKGCVTPAYSEAFILHVHSAERALNLNPCKRQISLKSSIRDSS